MLKSILSTVIFSVINRVLTLIGDYLREKELEALRAKKATLEGKVEAMKQAAADEGKIEKVVEEVARVNGRATSIQDKLHNLAEHADKLVGD